MGGGQSTQSTPEAVAQPPSVGLKTPDANNNKGDTVIIPVDPSKQAESAFEWYYRHAHKPQNTVHVIHCQEYEHPSGEYYPDYAIPPEAFAEQYEKAHKSGSEIVEKYEKKLKDYGIKGSVEREVGRPGEIIIHNVDKLNASLIVMGSRGFGVVRRTILGSVSEYVIHHTKVPVTVIPKETQSWFF